MAEGDNRNVAGEAPDKVRDEGGKVGKPEGEKPATLADETAERGRIRQGGQDPGAQAKTDRVNRSSAQLDVDELHRTEEQKRQTSQAEMDKLTSSEFTTGGDEQSFSYAGVPHDQIQAEHEARVERLHEERFRS